eukprot:TRINITY_DN6962_c0_g1_i1.p1 TRINITY_DN6962_c0_g1~~TRINITY_DN6962_c0_g1_i1.p1  ORF type:complete len:1107 (+),score=152.37 TRINITY_DN6962_c0_g1_i1:336-3656(+)
MMHEEEELHSSHQHHDVELQTFSRSGATLRNNSFDENSLLADMEMGEPDIGDVDSDSKSAQSKLKRGAGVQLSLMQRLRNFSRSIAKRIDVFSSKGSRYHSRTIDLNNNGGGTAPAKITTTSYPANVTRNQKYNFLTFFPVVLYNQFKFFFNLYFLIVALSQFIPALQVGFLFTYIAPLAFVLTVTMMKEAWDDYKRWRRDVEVNSQSFQQLTDEGLVTVPSSAIKVGHLIVVNTNQRVPADMVLLRTTEKSGASFIRTDQLDGETDWKLRRAVAVTQKLPSDAALLSFKASFYAEKPKKDIYSFVGNCMTVDEANRSQVEPLSAENTLWANTVVASGTVVGLTIYTGPESRAAMNTSSPQTKVGLLDMEINQLSKVLFGLLLVLSFIMVVIKGFKGIWPIYYFRFVLLFSSIIPISLRVNLDMAKTVYSLFIMRDKHIPDTVVRTSTIPEELGRIEYLLSDKTGTLTQNDMVFKKLHIGTISFSKDTLEDIREYLHATGTSGTTTAVTEPSPMRGYRQASTRNKTAWRVHEVVMALALCHNVSPVIDDQTQEISYQASSPDEVALVKFTESVGVTLVGRSVSTITLRLPHNQIEEFEVLQIFPFSSERKRMGIILKHTSTGQIIFYMKGADSVMARIAMPSDWLDEECGNMAREGLRTLVFGCKRLSERHYQEFVQELTRAKSSIYDREEKVAAVLQSIETDLELLALTGVEDKLQDNVKDTLETLRNAGIKVWMLTGDKIETATCIAVSSKLVSRTQGIFTLLVHTKEEAWKELNDFADKGDSCLIIDGGSLQLCLDNCPDLFVSLACKAPAVVCCRCSPQQKAEIVTLLKKNGKRTCAIGDGGNDVSMIQAAHVGIGIVGKEGKQASLAADFSITQFSHLTRLILWHGRNSYKRSARLSHFVIHRGLIISFIQAVFSAMFYFAAIAIYNGWLMVGYATCYTMAPVFSLVLDEDVTEDIAFRYPELYQQLQKGRELSYRTFLLWVMQSIYQGGVIMLLAIFLFESSLINIVAITFTTLILSELLNVAFEIHKWNRWIVLSEVLTFFLYFASMFVLRSYFDITFIFTWDFMWKVAVLTVVSCLPVYLASYIKQKYDPPSYTKLSL